MSNLAIKQRPFTTDEYHAMACAGILTEEDRVELIDGLIIAMSPIGPEHLYCVTRLTRLFERLLLTHGFEDIFVSVQNPVHLAVHQEPEPDLLLFRPLREEPHLPIPNEVLLLVEVADTSLTFDREVKVPRYAAAGICEVWIVALAEEQVEIYRRPGSDGYAEIARHGRGETITMEALPEVGSVSVEAVLGPSRT